MTFRGSRWKKPLTLLAGWLLAALPAHARLWTDDLNRTWQGDFVRMDGVTAVFMVNGKEYPYPIAHMSAPDKLAIFKLRTAPPAAPAAASPAAVAMPPAAGTPSAALPAVPTGEGKAASFAGSPLVPGKTTKVEVPLNDVWGKQIAKYYSADKPPATHIDCAMAVPPGFDPDKPQRVLIASTSSTGDTPSIRIMSSIFEKDALAHGWVVVAADGPDGKPKEDNIAFRADLLTLMVSRLGQDFPRAKTDWTFATAGFSGGAGYASHQALVLTREGWRVIGMMLLNGNFSPAQWESYVHGPVGKSHAIPVFYSGGENDGTVTPAQLKEVIAETKRGGYQQMRVEWHPGKHQAWNDHVNLALEWFDTLAQAAPHDL